MHIHTCCYIPDGRDHDTRRPSGEFQAPSGTALTPGHTDGSCRTSFESHRNNGGNYGMGFDGSSLGHKAGIEKQ